MQSKITIEVDFDNNNEPIIQIISRHSDDIRDKLIKYFIEKLGYVGNWGRIEWAGGTDGLDHAGFSRWIIRPITPKELREQAELMLEQARVYEANQNTVQTD